MSENKFHHEADRIALYLIKKSASDREKKIYADAMQELSISLSEKESKLWNRMLRSRSYMANADAGLALLRSSGNIRRKIFTMLAILEASPDHVDLFISKKRSSFYFFKIILVGIRASFRGCIGYIRIKTSWSACI